MTDVWTSFGVLIGVVAVAIACRLTLGVSLETIGKSRSTVSSSAICCSARCEWRLTEQKDGSTKSEARIEREKSLCVRDRSEIKDLLRENSEDFERLFAKCHGNRYVSRVAGLT
jgi:hypothetical protein